MTVVTAYDAPVGKTIVYAYMRSLRVICSHETGCLRSGRNNKKENTQRQYKLSLGVLII